MGKAQDLRSHSLWLILSPEGYIKKSIKDESLAAFEDGKAASRQVNIISEANSERCSVGIFSLCYKENLDAYVEIHNEMYEMLKSIVEEAKDYERRTGNAVPWGSDADLVLAKARGEL